MDDTRAYELYLQAYSMARCGFDASSYYGIHAHKLLPWALVIAVAAHDGAGGREPRTQGEFVEALARFNVVPVPGPAGA